MFGTQFFSHLEKAHLQVSMEMLNKAPGMSSEQGFQDVILPTKLIPSQLIWCQREVGLCLAQRKVASCGHHYSRARDQQPVRQDLQKEAVLGRERGKGVLSMYREGKAGTVISFSCCCDKILSWKLLREKGLVLARNLWVQSIMVRKSQRLELKTAGHATSIAEKQEIDAWTPPTSIYPVRDPSPGNGAAHSGWSFPPQLA